MDKASQLFHPTYSLSEESKPILTSEIGYGLMTLIELADSFECNGTSLTHIVKKYKYNIHQLKVVISKLEEADLISRHPDNPEWLSLKQSPCHFWILRVLPILKGIFLTDPKLQTL